MSKKIQRSLLPAWTPFQEAFFPPGATANLIESEPGFIGVFRNSRYQVQMRTYSSPIGEMLWLSIVSIDRSARHDWRDLQRIKNELCGEEREALELFPAESRLVDTNNQYHLFVLPEGAVAPFGYMERDVADTQISGSSHKQRPFDVRPKDLNACSRENLTVAIVGPAKEE